MEYVTLGKTNLMVSRSSLGTRLLEDLSDQEAGEILREAYEGGINFIDTSSSYSGVEKKIGEALYTKRKDLILSSGTKATLGTEAARDLEKSLEALMTDFIDIYHIQRDDYLPVPGTDDGLYNQMLSARGDGKIRFIGFCTKNLQLAKEALESGLYDTIRYPLNIFSTEEELNFIKDCEKADIGLIAMKTLDGGKIENVPIAFGFLRQYENLVSIWGARNIDEIQKLLYFESNPPAIDEKFMEELEDLRKNQLN